MIEKLNLEEVNNPGEATLKAFSILNQLVDAVNGILAAQEQYATIYNEDIVPMLTPVNEEPADPYAEQRKWIGKLCRFYWGQGCYYGILTNIKRKAVELRYESNGRAFRTCEPVKPDDDIIYKGGDNE